MSTFSRKGDVLTATGQLDARDYTEFDGLCRETVEDAEGDVVVDFSEVDLLPSVYVGAIFGLHRDLEDQGRGMTLKLSGTVRKLMERAGLGRFVSLID